MGKRKEREPRTAAPPAAARNPFESYKPRQKHEVLGRRVKGAVRNTAAAQSKAIRKRQESLLQEFRRTEVDNSFRDRRLGEGGGESGSTEADRALQRFVLERQRRLSSTAQGAGGKRGRGATFSLEDDDEGAATTLTHDGQPVSSLLGAPSARREFDNGYDDDDDDDDDGLGGKMDTSAMFGGGDHDADRANRTKKEVMEEVILKSKMHRAERQKEKEEQVKVMGDLDADFGEIRSLMELSEGVRAPHQAAEDDGHQEERPNKKERERRRKAELASEEGRLEAEARALARERGGRQPDGAPRDDMDEFLAEAQQLADEARARAAQRLLTPEDIARKQRETLEKQEAERLRRMGRSVGAGATPSVRRDDDDHEEDQEDPDDDDAAEDEDETGGGHKRARRSKAFHEREHERAREARETKRLREDMAVHPTDDDLVGNFHIDRGLNSANRGTVLLKTKKAPGRGAAVSEAGGDVDSAQEGSNSDDDDEEEEEEEGDAEDEESDVEGDSDDEDSEEDDESDDSGDVLGRGDDEVFRDVVAGGDLLRDEELESESDGESDADPDGDGDEDRPAKRARTSDGGADESAEDHGVPFTIPAPASHRALLELLRGRTLDQQRVVLNRVVAYTHPSLGPDARKKMTRFFGLLLEHVRFLCAEARGGSDPLGVPLAAQLDLLTAAVYQLCELMPRESAEAVRTHVLARIRKSQQQRVAAWLGASPAKRRTISCYPDGGDLACLQLIGRVYPTSDARHNVVVPAMLLMSEVLVSTPISGRRDVAAALFLADLLTSFVRDSRRYLPEVVAFMCELLPRGFDAACDELSAPAVADDDVRSDSPLPVVFRPGSNIWSEMALPSSSRSSLLLLPAASSPERETKKEKKKKKKEKAKKDEEKVGEGGAESTNGNAGGAALMASLAASRLPLRALLAEDNSDPWLAGSSEFLPNSLMVALRLVGRLANLYGGVPSFPEVASRLGRAVRLVADRVSAASGDSVLARVSAHLAESVLERAASSERARMQLVQYKAPKSLKMYDPVISARFVPGKPLASDPDRRRAELTELKRKVRKEKRGAMKELRKDTSFIAKEQRKDDREEALQRDKERRRVMTEFQREVADANRSRTGKVPDRKPKKSRERTAAAK